jgi:hypothetical protein
MIAVLAASRDGASIPHLTRADGLRALIGRRVGFATSSKVRRKAARRLLSPGGGPNPSLCTYAYVAIACLCGHRVEQLSEIGRWPRPLRRALLPQVRQWPRNGSQLDPLLRMQGKEYFDRLLSVLRR